MRTAGVDYEISVQRTERSHQRARIHTKTRWSVVVDGSVDGNACGHDRRPSAPVTHADAVQDLQHKTG